VATLAEQFAKLGELFPSAKIKEIGDGQSLVTVVDVRLPLEKWNRPATEVCFVVPRGYPLANPDCFFAEEGLRLANGAMPKNSALQSQPYFSGQRLWFSWHFQGWNPNRDSLFTYVKMIQDRLNRPE